MTISDTEQQVDYANDTSAVFDLNKVVGLRETHLVEAITGEPEETSGENYGHVKSDYLHERFIQVAAHEVSEKIKRYLEKKHLSKVCSVIWNLSMNLITIQEVPLLSPVEMHTSIIKRSSTSYSLFSFYQSKWSLAICTIFATCKRL